jgi:5-methylcytosine-specific restriction endonuclease McrA
MYEILFLHGTNCHICNLPIDFSAPRQVSSPGWENALHLDHVIPLSKGGSDQIENVKPSHGKCNLIKGNTLLSESKHPRYTPIRSVPRAKYY